MKVVIIGCGRVGAVLAATLDTAGHQVTIVDPLTRSFDRLPSTFAGEAIRGDGTDEDVLRRAGAEGADAFLSLTEGDNRNIMAAQLAREAFDIRLVYAKVNDPVRAEAYAELGIGTICRTTMLAGAAMGVLGLPIGDEPSVREGAAHAHDDAPGPVVGAGRAAGREG